MARPRGAARSRQHVPPLDKPSRSGLLALRRFHDGLQTPTLVRLLVRTEKEEIMPRPHPHDIPKRNRIWKPEISKCDFFFCQTWRLRHRCKGHRAGIWRRSEAKHCSSLCSQSEGGEYCGGQARSENSTKLCPRALVMFATCSWPSLCEQSELQCWRRNRRLCEPVQISAARILPLTFDISILNTLPITHPKIRVIRCYAVRAQHHLSLSRLRGRTKKIGHPNGVPDSSLQINYIGDDLVPQSFANALMV